MKSTITETEPTNGSFSIMRQKLLLLLVPFCLLASACVPWPSGSGSNELGSRSGGQSSGESLDVAVPGYVDLMLIYRWAYVFNVGQVYKSYAVILFDDGTYSTDLNRILAFGTDASKSDSASKWGTWKGDPGKDSFEMFDRDGGALTLSATGLSEDLSSGHRLNRCYSGVTSIGLATPELGETASSLSSNEFCFQDNGVFSTTSSGSTLTPEMVGAASSSDAGLYQIDGNIIRLTFGDGTVVEKFLGVYNGTDPQSVISLGSPVLFAE